MIVFDASASWSIITAQRPRIACQKRPLAVIGLHGVVVSASKNAGAGMKVGFGLLEAGGEREHACCAGLHSVVVSASKNAGAGMKVGFGLLEAGGEREHACCAGLHSVVVSASKNAGAEMKVGFGLLEAGGEREHACCAGLHSVVVSASKNAGAGMKVGWILCIVKGAIWPHDVSPKKSQHMVGLSRPCGRLCHHRQGGDAALVNTAPSKLGEACNTNPPSAHRSPRADAN